MRLGSGFSKGFGIACLAILASVVCVQGAVAQVKLTPSAQPPTAVAGTSVVYLTGNNYPGGVTAADVTVSFAPSCLTTPTATAAASGVVHLIGTTDRVSVLVPASLATGTYAVWTTGGAPSFTSTTCSSLMVTSSTKKIASCIPSSSLAVSLGTNVNAYVPHGCWSCSGTGVGVVPVEGSGTAAVIPTTHVVNACSANSVTGETVCTANNTDVYLITGTTLNTTLTSGANGFASFSGGSCENCGVAINAANNTAYIEEGISGGPDGIQALNLGTNTFATPFAMHFRVSENIAIDPNLNYIFSPGEDSNYTVVQIAPDGTLTEFGKSVSEGDLDSASEDCTTGLALSSSEFTNDVFIQDMTQAVFTSGAPGSYTAPGQFVTISPGGFAAGTSGISVAPGSGHLAVVTGEFGGSVYAVLQLPNTSGTGTPTIPDWAVTNIPANPAGGSSPCGFGFSAGLDPHTLTAYTSPNDGKAYALFSSSPVPTCLVRVDLAAVLAAPRVAGSHQVATNPASAYTYYPVP